MRQPRAPKQELSDKMSKTDVMLQKRQHALEHAEALQGKNEDRISSLRRDLDCRGVLKPVAPAFGRDPEDRMRFFLQDVQQRPSAQSLDFAFAPFIHWYCTSLARRTLCRYNLS